jgi:hypothetical protein
MQNDAALMLYMRSHAVRIAARGRLRGFSPAMDRLLHPHAFSDVEEADIVRLLLRPHPVSIACYRCRHALAVGAGALLGAALWYFVRTAAR